MLEQEKKHDVYKGQGELSPPEIVADYFRKLASGWNASEYQLYRKLWKELPVRQEVKDYPIEIVFRLTTVCNLRCPMCYNTLVKVGEEKGDPRYFNDALFYKIIDEIAGHCYSIRLTANGEPTLHPSLIDFVRYAKQKGIQEINLISNGSLLEPEYFEALAEAGLDWLILSVDGIEQTYESVRSPLKFKDTVRRIRQIYEWKTTHDRVKPVVKVQAVLPFIRENPDAFYRTFAPYVDLVSFNVLHNYTGKIVTCCRDCYAAGFVCPQLYQRLVICPDGKVMPCCQDDVTNYSIGSVYTSTIHDVWHGKQISDLRTAHVAGDYSFPPCNTCSKPLKTVFDEKIEVAGRSIWIENFVAGPQE